MVYEIKFLYFYQTIFKPIYMHYYITTTIEGQFDETIDRVTDSLKTYGFGVLSVINVHKTLKEKIDVDFKPYTILGACNPQFANKALRLEDKLGVLLPCNVVVIDQGNGQIEVAAMEPNMMMHIVDNEELHQLANEVSSQLTQMINGL
jgi:uncharacterized protein (DUF302 family)